MCSIRHLYMYVYVYITPVNCFFFNSQYTLFTFTMGLCDSLAYFACSDDGSHAAREIIYANVYRYRHIWVCIDMCILWKRENKAEEEWERIEKRYRASFPPMATSSTVRITLVLLSCSSSLSAGKHPGERASRLVGIPSGSVDTLWEIDKTVDVRLNVCVCGCVS